MADAAALRSIGAERVVTASLEASLEAVACEVAPVLLRWPGATLSPYAADFAAAVLDAGENADALAAVGFAVPRVRAGSAVPLLFVEDGGDAVYVRRTPAAAALVTPAQARRFLAWRAGRTGPAGFADYLRATGAFVALPRTALAYPAGADSCWHRALPVAPRAWYILPPAASLALYDEDGEPAPAAVARLDPALAREGLTVDLWGDRRAVATPYLLSTRPCRAPVAAFGARLVPLEANLAFGAQGALISLGRTEDFAPMPPARRKALHDHAGRRSALSGYLGQFLPPRLRRLLGASG